MRRLLRCATRWERGLAGLRRQLALVKSFEISTNDLVLDVGSGQNPNLRADVLCDRFVSDASERACGATLVADRPLVVADAEELPFRDRAFDFVICSHLLEHVRDPVKLLGELQRVARRGYIETPSSVHERLYGNPFHKWYVDLADGTLQLVAKPEARPADPIQTWFRRLYENDLDVQDWVNHRLEELGFLVRYHWEDNIDVVVHGELPENGDFVFATPSEKEDGSAAPKTLGQKLKHDLSRWMRRRSRPNRETLLELLACSHCKAYIREVDGELHCRNGHHFETRGELIFMA